MRKIMTLTWNDVLGPFARQEDLTGEELANPGLIELQTSSGTDVYPIFQFDTDGSSHNLNPHIATAWPIIRSLQIEQLGESSWTAASRLTTARAEFEQSSWADILKASEVTDERVEEVYIAIVVDALKGARMGIDLQDPTGYLPESSAEVYARVIDRALEQLFQH